MGAMFCCGTNVVFRRTAVEEAGGFPETSLTEDFALSLRLHEAGYTYQRTRSWVHTGYALRKRKSGTVTTYDQETPEKKD